MTSYRQGKVEDLVRREPVFVAPDQTLRAVAHAMWVENVGALVVGDGQKSLGIISERDLAIQIGGGADPDTVTAREAMTSNMIAAKVGDTLDEAAYQMLEVGIRHVPLVDDGGRVVGMVSIRDLLRPLLSDGLRNLLSGESTDPG